MLIFGQKPYFVGPTILKSTSELTLTCVRCRSIVVIIVTCGHVWTCPNLFRIFAWAVDGLRDLKRIESSLGRRVYARWPLVWPHFYRTLSNIITCLPLCPKPSTIPLKKYFKSCGQLSKSCQKLQNSDFQSKFSMSKIIRICLNYFFIEEYHFMSILFVIDILWQFPFWKIVSTKCHCPRNVSIPIVQWKFFFERFG